MEAYRSGALDRKSLMPNIIAGIIVGVVSLPLSMAFAIASGVGPEAGLLTAIIAGPTWAFVVILLGILNQHGSLGLQMATMMAGVMLILMGVFKMGAVIRFIPAPVIAGFTAGIGEVIWIGQWPSFFGIPGSDREHVHERVLDMLRSLPDMHIATTGFAIVGLLISVFATRVQPLKRVPAPLLAMVAVTLIQAIVKFEGVATINSTYGGLSAGVPDITLPSMSFSQTIDLLVPAFTIAMLCAIESLPSAVVADGMIGTRHDSNQELIGQGGGQYFRTDAWRNCCNWCHCSYRYKHPQRRH